MKARLSWAHGKEQIYGILEGTCEIALNSLRDNLRGLRDYMKILTGCSEEGKKMRKRRDGDELGTLKRGILVTHKRVVHFSSQTLHLIITNCPPFFSLLIFFSWMRVIFILRMSGICRLQVSLTSK